MSFGVEVFGFTTHGEGHLIFIPCRFTKIFKQLKDKEKANILINFLVLHGFAIMIPTKKGKLTIHIYI